MKANLKRCEFKILATLAAEPDGASPGVTGRRMAELWPDYEKGHLVYSNGMGWSSVYRWLLALMDRGLVDRDDGWYSITEAGLAAVEANRARFQRRFPT